jgi:hypothetical protein
MKHYAIIENGVVTNVAVWDGKTEWTPKEGKAVEIAEGVSAGIGWDYDGKKFVDKRPVQDFDEA